MLQKVIKNLKYFFKRKEIIHFILYKCVNYYNLFYKLKCKKMKITTLIKKVEFQMLNYKLVKVRGVQYRIYTKWNKLN